MAPFLAPPIGSLDALGEERLKAANICPATGLATDYLNHFNEVIMLLELAPDMPDIVHEALGWEPLDYEEHYLRSNYRDKELVLDAYRCAPLRLRRHIHDLIDTMDAVLVSSLDKIRKDPEGPEAGVIAAATAERVKMLAAEAAGLMNGFVKEEDEIFGNIDGMQANVDELIG